MIKRIAVVFLFPLLLAGCASGRVVQLSDKKVSGSKTIALDAPNTPWVIEIQNRLRQKGFKVLRWASRSQVTEKTKATRVESFKEAEARYVLVIDGYAAYDWAHRCFGGGYDFNHISTDLVDVVTNETILNVNGAGFSEDCPPLSGTIFADIANAVAALWEP